MTLLTAVPLTLALCSGAGAIGVSNAAKERKSICAELAGVNDKNDPRYVLKEFCDRTTFHCTSHGRGGVGLFGKVKGVCDDPRLCTNEQIKKACQEQCVDARSGKFGIKDKKSEDIEKKLNQCPMKPGMAAVVEPVAPRRNSMINQPRGSMMMQRPSITPPQAPSVLMDMPGSEVQMQPGQPVVQEAPVMPSRRDSIGRRGSVMMPSPYVPAQKTVEDSVVSEMESQPSLDFVPPPPPVMQQVAPLAPPPPPMGYKPARQGGSSIAANQAYPQVPQANQQMMSQPDNLLSQIRGGKQLRKPAEQPIGAPQAGNSRDDLLAAIRQGKKLNSSQERQLKEQPQTAGEFDLGSALKKRFEGVNGNYEDDAAEDDEDGKWD
ncbi:WH2 domain-containing protein [Candidatus Paracaedibacter symbiosus]|uniref:WH2 domain-containing protein n=1 Tax=Candidatus Paracaedibacter symbiosus TaxID=244582 RepID=UPI0018DEA49B|nr:WH2 domain-containing protein [Candidatus Paracaedibacter symbiosus]